MNGQNMFIDRMVNAETIKSKTKGHKSHNGAPVGKLFQKVTDDYGETFLKEVDCNIVTVGGALGVLQRLSGVDPVFMPATINELLGVTPTGTPTGNNVLALFGVGTGGSGLANGSVYDPSAKQHNVADQVPIRYTVGTITGEDAGKYFMKKSGGGVAPDSYFLKEFAEPPVIKALWKNGIGGADGTEITSDPANAPNTEGIETFLEININLNIKDVREYFEATSAVESARYNTFGFYTGEKIGEEYHNVRLYSVITFNNRPLDLETSSEFVYRVYTMI